MAEKVGIWGYGVYVPWERIETEKIVRHRGRLEAEKKLDEKVATVRYGLLLKNKAVAGISEDSITLGTEASENAIARACIRADKIGSVYVGSESKPYAVGQIARHVASFVGVGGNVFTADMEGACNAGMQAVSSVESDILGEKIKYGLAVGTDIAQADSGDPLEYACGAGAAAFVLGPEDDKNVATIEAIAPYSSLTLDFWRRDNIPVPSHLGQTTVEAYVRHTIMAINELLKKNPDMQLKDFDYITFHQPSGYMPLKTCKIITGESNKPFLLEDLISDSDVRGRMKLTPEDVENKVKPYLKVLDTGNTYAASTMIAISSILDSSVNGIAEPGQKILAVSYGSGAYSYATVLKICEGLRSKVKLAPTVDEYVARKNIIGLETYGDHLKKRFSSMKERLIFPRIVGEIEALEGELFQSQCDSCKKIYYPPRDKCLNPNCKGRVEKRKYPRVATLKDYAVSQGMWRNPNLEKTLKGPVSTFLEDKKLYYPNSNVYYDGRVLIVDATDKDVRRKDILEAVIRVIDYEGSRGHIVYGITYRPLFRKMINAKS